MATTANKVLGEADVQNKAGLTAEQLSALSDDLSKLRDVAPDLPEAAIAYVVDGTGAGVLLRLSGTKGAGEALQLAGCQDRNILMRGKHRAARVRLFKSATAEADAGVFLRLAEVYDAAAQPDRTSYWRVPLGLPDWLGLFLHEVSNTTSNVYAYGQAKAVPFPADLVERVAVAGGLPADALVRAVVMADLKDYYSRYALHLITALQGFSAVAGRHAPAVRDGLDAKEAERRLHVLELIATTGIDLAPFAERIVELAVSPAKTVRKAAEPLLAKAVTAAGPLVRARAEAGSNDERYLAVQVLWRLEGEQARAYLRERVEKEPAAKVKAAIGELLAEQEPAAGAAAAAPPDLPPVEPVQQRAPLTAGAEAALAAIWQAGWEERKRDHERHPQHHRVPPAAPTDADVAEAAGLLAEMTPGERGFGRLSNRLAFLHEPAMKFAARPDVSLVHLVRLAELVGARNDYYRRQSLVEQMAVRHYHAHPPGFALRDLAAAFEAVGRGATEVNRVILRSAYQGSPLLGLAPAHVWPYYAEHPDLLAETWEGKGEYAYQGDARRRLVFQVLAMFPALPPQYVRMCWDIAFHGGKKERPMAQAALNGVPGQAQRLLASLTAGKAEHRAIAAEWLGRIGHRDAVPAVKAALAREKHDVVAGAMMGALEALGVPLEEFVSAGGLLKEAVALLAKGVPKDLAWFAFDRMPKVRWAGSGRPVRREILQWMVLQGGKLGNPEPGPRLRQYTKRFDRGDAEALGQYVLEAWIAQDTVPHTHEQAHKHAEGHAAAMARGQAQHPQYYKGTPEQWYREAYNAKVNEPVGSANRQKGILAVAGACCGGRAGGPVERYLKTYFGHRVHQCKALLQMLAWVEHPSAIQVLLSVANRFRTAGIRKEAERLVQALAERKDWTVDELADRTIPTGGFDEGTGLALDYGARKFTAALDAELNVVLKNEEGKAIKALPAPRHDDDAEKAKAAKKALSAAKKEVEAVLKLQRERLYEAMCTQRAWAFADWDQFLNRHPIARTYCQRLVWGIPAAAGAEDAGADGSGAARPLAVARTFRPLADVSEDAEGTVIRPPAVARTFRPLADGSLTDTNDDAVTVGPGERVVLAHDSTVAPDVAKAWLRHLADYDVRPLFEQFGKAGYRPPAEKRDESAVADFHGHLLEAFRLRGRLTKLGYTRGQAGDGGWFSTYHKHFASLGFTATVEFTGSPLPEENRTVAVLELYFERSGGGPESPYASTANRLSLGSVPPVLLSECYNDVRQAAAEGTGFDPDWEKKSAY